MAEPLRTAAIRAEPNVYDVDVRKVMGRQAAGSGFLRAAVAARAGGTIYGYTPHADSARHFASAVQGQDPLARVVCLKPQLPHTLAEAGGVVYLADPMLSSAARLRLRAGMAHYALCGVTHTLAGASVLQQLGELLTEPVAPWDALVCTSTAALEIARRVIEAQADYLRWKLGPGVRPSMPQLPVIPLGVHVDDFAFGAQDRAAAREALGIDAGEVAAVYVGRLAHRVKAHPFPMFHGLQAATERTGKRVALVLCGKMPNEATAQAFTTGAALFAPDVRLVVVDGGEKGATRQAYAGGDLFVSLSDGIQETFGLTPLEAMAAGLPVVVTDWNGYRDTVRHGVDGFRVATWAPAADDDNAAARHEVEALSYDSYHGSLAASTSVDFAALAEALTALIGSPDLRRTLGEAGRQRARELFDWPIVFRQYQALWGEQNARRLTALARPETVAALAAGPKAAASRLDPFHTFSHYPTDRITPDTRVRLAPGVTLDTYRLRQGHALFRGAIIPESRMAAMINALQDQERTVRDLTAIAPTATLTVVGVLAKMGLIELRQP